jgi:glycosyltransferase involved in cell wall biosynthesis
MLLDHAKNTTFIFDYNPLVSILLCTYNRARYLPDCIESVINQTNQDWELVIMDDGSTDDTFQIVDAYMQKHPNIRYLKHQNKKVACARNLAMMASFGSYITFLDSDDRYKPDHIQSRLDFMLAHPDIDLIEGGIDIEADYFLSDYYHPDQLISIRDCIAGATFFGKRAVFFTIGGYKLIDYAEDAEFWARAEKVFTVAKIAEPKTYIYSRAEDSITRLETARLMHSV